MRQICSMLRQSLVSSASATLVFLASRSWIASASSHASAARLSQSAVVTVCSIANKYLHTCRRHRSNQPRRPFNRLCFPGERRTANQGNQSIPRGRSAPQLRARPILLLRPMNQNDGWRARVVTPWHWTRILPRIREDRAVRSTREAYQLSLEVTAISPMMPGRNLPRVHVVVIMRLFQAVVRFAAARHDLTGAKTPGLSD